MNVGLYCPAIDEEPYWHEEPTDCHIVEAMLWPEVAKRDVLCGSLVAVVRANELSYERADAETITCQQLFFSSIGSLIHTQ